MKFNNTYFIFVLLFFFNLFSYSQKNTIEDIQLQNRKNEIRVDVLKKSINDRLELNYERFLNNKFSIGLSTTFLEGKFVKNDFKNLIATKYINEYQIVPFFRYLFSHKNYLSNWYAEAFSSINGGYYKKFERIEENSIAFYDEAQKKYTNIGLGASIGYKFYNIKRIAVDMHFGAGGQLNNQTNQVPDGITRIGIDVGYRF